MIITIIIITIIIGCLYPLMTPVMCSKNIFRSYILKLKKSYPRNRPWRPIGLWDVKIPRRLNNRLRDGGKVVSPTHQPHFTPQKHYYFYVSLTHSC
jgi:hypothetical protein